MNTNNQDIFSIWNVFSEAGLLVNLFSTLIFLITIFSIYLFFEKLFFLKRQIKIKDDTLHNINDFIHEGRVDTALDYCEREDTPQTRILKPGIERIGRPIQEISTAMKFQEIQEIYHFQKKIPLISFYAKIVLLMGILGTFVALFLSFYDVSKISEKINPQYLYFRIYRSLLPLILGFVSSIALYSFHFILMKKIRLIKSKLVKSQAAFINILNKP